MGQYWIAVFLAPRNDANADVISAFISPEIDSFGTAKLMEHASVGNGFVRAVEYHLSPDGALPNSRLVWAGDYAGAEPASEHNLYYAAVEANPAQEIGQPAPDGYYYRYLVNHSKRQFLDKGPVDSQTFAVHPLPLLTAEGNGNGGGDYRGRDKHLCGVWSRDVLSADNQVPEGYVQLSCNFE